MAMPTLEPNAGLTRLRRDVAVDIDLYRNGPSELRARALLVLRAQATRLVRRHLVGFADGSIDDLIACWTDHRYRPTLRADLDPELGVLADLYDVIAEAKGCRVEAYRG